MIMSPFMISGVLSLLAVCGIVYTIVTLVQWNHEVLLDNSLRQDFAKQVSLVGTRISTLFNNAQQQLVALAQFAGAAHSAVAVEDRLSNVTFFKLARGLKDKTQDYALTFVWAPRVARSNISEHEAEVRSINGPEVFQKYSVKSNRTGAEYVVPILYASVVVSVQQFDAFFGYDLLDTDARRVAIDRAMATGERIAIVEPALTGPQTSVPIYQPAVSYRTGEPIGVVYCTMSVLRFANLTLSEVNTTNIQVQLTDHNATTGESVSLYLLQPDLGSIPVRSVQHSEPLIANFTFDFAQRSWRLDMQHVGPLVDRSEPVAAYVVLGVSIVLIAAAVVVALRNQSVDTIRSKQLLQMVVPEHVIAQLMPNVTRLPGGEVVLTKNGTVAEYYDPVTLCFIDICNFTLISSHLMPASIVRFLDEFVTLLDEVLSKYPRVLKIKTIGDAYMIAAGVNKPDQNARRFSLGGSGNSSPHVGRRASLDNEWTPQDPPELAAAPEYVRNLVSALRFCCQVQELIQQHKFHVEVRPGTRRALAQLKVHDEHSWRVVNEALDLNTGLLKIKVRQGVHLGDIVAGVIGTRRPQYDVWSSACNIASRMESSAPNGSIQVSDDVYQVLLDHSLTQLFHIKPRAVLMTLKGVGRMPTHFVRSSDTNDIDENVDLESCVGDD